MSRRQVTAPEGVVLAAVLILGCAPQAGGAQQADPVPDELAWVGLFNGELVGWLENVNLLTQRCGAPTGSMEWETCRERHTTPRVLVIPVWDGPRRDATRLGELVVVAQPGSPLGLHVSAGGVATPFTPDLYLADWGYGPPYFHLTILAREDPWFRVPIPGIGAAWIDGRAWRGEAGGPPHVEVLAADGRVITTPQGDMVVLAVEEGALRVRPEKGSDMWCEPGDPPAESPRRELRLPFEDLFGPDGRSLVSFKYMKGC